MSGRSQKKSDGIVKVSDRVRKVSYFDRNGVRKVSESAIELSLGVRKMSEGVRKVSDGVRKLSDGVRKVSDGVRKMFDVVQNVSDVIKKLSNCFSEGVLYWLKDVGWSQKDIR